jgi:hypothetical protein
MRSRRKTRLAGFVGSPRRKPRSRIGGRNPTYETSTRLHRPKEGQMFRHRIKHLMILNAGVAILFALAFALSAFLSPPLVAIVVVMPVLTTIVIGSLVWVEAYVCHKRMQEVLRRGEIRPLAWVQPYLSRKEPGTWYRRRDSI